MQVTIFFDYVCPYVYRASQWLETVQARVPELELVWRYFSLSQINNREPGWEVWAGPRHNPEGWSSDPRLRGLRAQWAAEAARQQGAEAFQRFHYALLRAIHQDQRSLYSDEATRQAAEEAQLELPQWEAACQSLEHLAALRRDHEAAIEHRVFGTPTFLFPGSEPAYLKLSAIPQKSEALRYWRSFQRTVADHPLFLEIKRPQ